MSFLEEISVFLVLVLHVVVLRIEASAYQMLGKRSTTDLYPQSSPGIFHCLVDILKFCPVSLKVLYFLQSGYQSG